MPMIIRIKLDDWETLGDASLEGMMVAQNQPPYSDEIILEIEQTSLQWRSEHNGPEMLIVPEYVPLCLMRSILNFVSRGHKISIVEAVEEKDR